ncbi:MAG: EpsD family peptidyl-prolyl cis-trans isomerase [Pseudomonadota bacterium]
MFNSKISRGLLLSVTLILFVGCGDEPSEKGASSNTQTAVRVGSTEITVHQINQALGQAPNINPEQLKEASNAVLDKLIDQELLVQQAAEKKLDRDPQVVMALDAARQEMLAKIYLEQMIANVSKPTYEEMRTFYRDNPELFSQRKIYSLQELRISVSEERKVEIKDSLNKLQNMNQIMSWLRENDIAFVPSGGTKAAESLPMAALKQLHKMQAGQTGILSSPSGLVLIHLAAVRDQPLDEKNSIPRIEYFLMSQKKAEAATNELKRLRSQADIRYFGEFSPVDKSKAQTLSTDVENSEQNQTVEKENTNIDEPTAKKDDLGEDAIQRGLKGFN